MSGNDPLRVAFLGLGWWGEVLADAALASGAAEITGGFARTPATRDGFASKYKCRGYDSMEALLADTEVEAVVIATPNSGHKEQALAAARAGKHIHMEKPMALSVSDAREMVAACREAGVKLGLGQNFRRWPMFRRAKKMIDAGELGTVSLVSAHFSNTLGLTAGEGSDRWDPVENPGGPLYSYTIHLADLMESLFGEIESVDAAAGKVGGPSGTDDAVAAVLRFKSGVVGSLTGSYMAAFNVGVLIEGTKATLSLTGRGMPTLQRLEAGMDEAEEIDIGVGLVEGRNRANAEQFTDLARCVREGGDPEVGGEQGVRALGVMRAMLLSHAERRAVTMEEIIEND